MSSPETSLVRPADETLLLGPIYGVKRRSEIHIEGLKAGQ